jgi:hypothetical protein
MDTAYNIEQGGFARASWPYERFNISFSDINTNISQGHKSPETHPYLFNV